MRKWLDGLEEKNLYVEESDKKMTDGKKLAEIRDWLNWYEVSTPMGPSETAAEHCIFLLAEVDRLQEDIDSHSCEEIAGGALDAQEKAELQFYEARKRAKTAEAERDQLRQGHQQIADTLHMGEKEDFYSLTPLDIIRHLKTERDELRVAYDARCKQIDEMYAERN